MIPNWSSVRVFTASSLKLKKFFFIAMLQQKGPFYYRPSFGISSCVRTIDTVMCLHTWRSSAMQLQGGLLIRGLYPNMSLMALSIGSSSQRLFVVGFIVHHQYIYKDQLKELKAEETLKKGKMIIRTNQAPDIQCNILHYVIFNYDQLFLVSEASNVTLQF